MQFLFVKTEGIWRALLCGLRERQFYTHVCVNANLPRHEMSLFPPKTTEIRRTGALESVVPVVKIRTLDKLGHYNHGAERHLACGYAYVHGSSTRRIAPKDLGEIQTNNLTSVVLRRSIGKEDSKCGSSSRA
jgi:hypothetical protein